MFPLLQTNRFYLQQITADDVLFVFEGLSHPDVIKYYGVSYTSFESTKAQMDWYRQIEQDGTGAWWKIVDKASAEAVGEVGYYSYNPQHNKCEIGYWLLPRFWGNRIVPEVLEEVIAYLQTEKKVHRVEALIEEGNEGSIKVAEKRGFTCEGKLRDYELKNGKYITLYLYSLLSTDFGAKP